MYLGIAFGCLEENKGKFEDILYHYEAMENNLKTVSQKEFDDFLMNDLATCMLYKQILTDVGKNKAGAS